MSTPATELEAQLAAFEKLYPAEGRNLRAAVTTSPELRVLLEQAISKGHLDGGFQPVSAAERARGTLGSYHAGSEVLSVPVDYLRAADTDLRKANTLLTTLGHEAAHAINKDAIQKTHDPFDTDMASVASGPPPRDHTATLKGFLDDARQRKATDEIGGVNVLAAKIRRENPGATQQQLYGKLYESTSDVEGCFDVSGTEEKPIYTPKPGITFNDPFQIEPNAANVAAFGQHFFDARGYPANDGQSVIDNAGEWEAKAQAADLARDPSRPCAPATINLGALGIEPDKVTLPSSVVNGTTPRLAVPVMVVDPEVRAADLQAKIATNKRDFDSRFTLAQLLWAHNQFVPAMDELLEIRMRDKTGSEDLPRKSFIAILDIIEPPKPKVAEGQVSPEDPTLATYRRRLSSVVLS